MVARVLLSWPALSLLAAGAFVGYAEAPRHVRATGALVVLDIMWIAALAGSLVVALVAPHPGPPQTAPLAMPIATAARLAGVGGAL